MQGELPDTLGEGEGEGEGESIELRLKLLGRIPANRHTIKLAGRHP